MSSLTYFLIGAAVGVAVAYWLLKSKLQREEINRKALAGKYAEKFVPFIKEYKYNPEDSYFLGMPVDFIVFDGLNEGFVKKIVIVEVKTGNSQLTSREKSIQDATTAKRIEYKLITLK